MIVKLWVRTDPKDRSCCSLRADYKRENSDSVRVANLGLDIYNAIQEMIARCHERGEVSA